MEVLLSAPASPPPPQGGGREDGFAFPLHPDGLQIVSTIGCISISLLRALSKKFLPSFGPRFTFFEKKRIQSRQAVVYYFTLFCISPVFQPAASSRLTGLIKQAHRAWRGRMSAFRRRNGAGWKRKRPRFGAAFSFFCVFCEKRRVFAPSFDALCVCLALPFAPSDYLKQILLFYKEFSIYG
jgi:hypothetical protein